MTVVNMDNITLEDAAKILLDLKIKLLFAENPKVKSIEETHFAQHIFLQALTDIERASQTLKLATLFQARELAGNF
jgi:hypothetical protein